MTAVELKSHTQASLSYRWNRSNFHKANIKSAPQIDVEKSESTMWLLKNVNYGRDYG